MAKAMVQWGLWFLDNLGILCPASPATAQQLGSAFLRSPGTKLLTTAIYNLYLYSQTSDPATSSLMPSK